MQDKKTLTTTGHVVMTEYYGNIVVEFCDDCCLKSNNEENVAILQEIVYQVWQNQEALFLTNRTPKKYQNEDKDT